VPGLLAIACGEGGGGGNGDGVRFRAVTFNTGSGGPPGSFAGGDFSDDLKTISDERYGNGLAWLPAVEATRQWLAETDPDVVAFQEIFYTGDCSHIPESDREGFVCEGWQPPDPADPAAAAGESVAQLVLGAGYQVVCHLGRPDKCAAVHERFGRFRGCDQDFCLEGMDGGRVEDCGSGSRVGRGVIDLVAGGTLTLVSFHGSSGVTSEDEACRLRQVNQVFVDLTPGSGSGDATSVGGDGPAANGVRNLILGDLNVDPVLWASFDDSAARWLDFVRNPEDPEATADRPFAFLSAAGEDAEPSYAALFNIDHVISDAATGDCWVAGVTEGHPYVLGADVHFDHKPVVCDLELPAEPP